MRCLVLVAVCTAKEKPTLIATRQGEVGFSSTLLFHSISSDVLLLGVVVIVVMVVIKFVACCCGYKTTTRAVYSLWKVVAIK